MDLDVTVAQCILFPAKFHAFSPSVKLKDCFLYCICSRQTIKLYFTVLTIAILGSKQYSWLTVSDLFSHTFQAGS